MRSIATDQQQINNLLQDAICMASTERGYSRSMGAAICSCVEYRVDLDAFVISVQGLGCQADLSFGAEAFDRPNLDQSYIRVVLRDLVHRWWQQVEQTAKVPPPRPASPVYDPNEGAHSIWEANQALVIPQAYYQMEPGARSGAMEQYVQKSAAAAPTKKPAPEYHPSNAFRVDIPDQQEDKHAHMALAVIVIDV